MKIVDLTGESRGVVGFHVDEMPDGGVIGRFEIGLAPNNVAVGQALPADMPTLDQVQFKFDKPESVAVFIHQLTKGYNRMGFLQLKEKIRQQDLAAAKKDEEKTAKKADLAKRIERMARELSAMQGEYAELNN